MDLQDFSEDFPPTLHQLTVYLESFASNPLTSPPTLPQEPVVTIWLLTGI